MQQRSPKRRSLLRIVGSILLVLSLLLFVWLLGGAVAGGWIMHADHYGAEFAAFGKWYFALAGAMTLAVILCFLRRDLPAAILGTAAYLPMLGILLKAISIADSYGWSGQTEQSFGRAASTVWRNGMMWNAVPLLLLLLLTLTRFFSYDAITQRRAKRNADENRPSPPILSDDTESEQQNSTSVSPPRHRDA